MKTEIKVPAMGESISEATVGAILKTNGSQVAMDDELLELETEKVNQVLYAPQVGTVTWNVSTGDHVKVGQVIGSIDSAGKAVPEKSKEGPVQPAAEKTKPSSPQPEQQPELSPQPQIPASGARITKEAYVADLTSTQKQPQPTPTTQPKPEPKQEAIKSEPKQETQKTAGERQETRRKMPKIRQVIAKRLVEAQHTAAMLTTFNEVDMTQILADRERYKESFAKQYGVKLGFMSFFVKAVVAALQQFPDLNSYIDGDEIVHREYYDIGIAVSTDRGLVVPVVRDCDKLSFAEIEKAIEAHAKKAREGGLSVNDLQGGGFTITNGGVYGSLLSTPILNPPQSGILGMHKISKRPVVVDDQIVIRSMMYLALSYDHRIVDGKEAVTFLVAIKNILEDPSRLVLKI